jgi:hypothetical protein
VLSLLRRQRKGKLMFRRVAVLGLVLGALGPVAAGVAAPLSAAKTSKFTGNVCALLTAKVVASVHVPANCKQQKTVKSALGTVTTGVWGKNLIGGPRLSVGINKASAAFLKAAVSSKAPGKPLGIGKWSGETGLANGKTADAIIFVADGYYVSIALNTPPNKPLKSSAPFIKLAKIVAKQL